MDCYKPVKRLSAETCKVEEFIAEGSYADGRLAYSKIVNGESDHSCAYYQIRFHGRLVMVRV